MDDFVAELRSRSHYPVFRSIAALMLGLGYLLALAVIGVALFAAANTPSGLLLLVVACPVAVVVALLAHLVRELLLMVADSADALLDIAGREAAPADTAAANLDWQHERQ